MPKKTVHRRRVVKKSYPKEELQENQEEIAEENSTKESAPEEAQSAVSQTQTDPPSLEQPSNVSPQVGSVSSPPQAISTEPVSPPVTVSESSDQDEEKTGAVSAEDSSESEESNEPIVAKNEAGSGRGIFKTLLSVIKYLLIFAIGVAIGGFVVYQNGGDIDFLNKAIQKDKASQKTETTPTTAPTEEPVDLTKYTIKVLNGSEIAGEASKLQDALEEAGFRVSSIGNASESSFLKTVIMAKTDVDEAFLEKLKTELLKTYKLSDVEELEESADDDIEIIVGAEPQ